MTTGAPVVVAATRTTHSKELRDAYLADFCQALFNYVAGGKRLSFVSSGDDHGRLVIALTIEDETALAEDLSGALRTGALSRRRNNLYGERAR